MKITAVKTAASVGHCLHLWVRIETDAGITGLGECVHGGTAAIALIHHLRPELVGRDPFQIDAIFEDLRRRYVFEGGFAGAFITALPGIEIALWGLKGKALGVPVYALLGGKFRDKIRLSECRKIANLAETYYIPFAPHNVASPVGSLASAHVCATIPNFLVLEFHRLHRDYWTTIIREKENIIHDGYITLTDRPGIGLDLDETVARQYQWPGTTWFE